MTIVLWALAIVLVAAGFVGIVLPALPGHVLIFAGLGTLLGFFLGLPGIIIGPFIGAVIGELTVHRDWKRVGKAGVAAWIGFAIGTAVKVAIAFVMVGLFALAWAF